MEKMSENLVSPAIKEALVNLKKDEPKEGVDLLDIAEKLSRKKFKKKG